MLNTISLLVPRTKIVNANFPLLFMALICFIQAPAVNAQECDGCGCPDGEGPTEATISFSYDSYCENDSGDPELQFEASGTSDSICWPSSTCEAVILGDAEDHDTNCTFRMSTSGDCAIIYVQFVPANGAAPGWACDLDSQDEDGWFFAVYQFECGTSPDLECPGSLNSDFAASGWAPGDCMGTTGGVSDPIPVGGTDVDIKVSGGGCAPLDEGNTCVGHDEDEDCGEDDGSAQAPETGSTDGNPVSLITGHKTERVTDISVQLPGRDYQLTREYTSDPYFYSKNAMGEYSWNGQWTTTVPGRLGAYWDFNGMRSLQASGPRDLTGTPRRFNLRGVPQNRVKQFNRFGATNLWIERGAGNRIGRTGFGDIYFTSGTGTTSVNGPVIRISKPGGDSITTYAGFGQIFNQGVFERQDIEGRVVHERDKYGNEWFYAWSSLGEGTFGNRDIVRLRSIYLNGTPGNELARVDFHWHGDSTAKSPFDSTPSTDARYGRLAEVEVIREDDQSQEVVTQSARYIYFDDISGLTTGGSGVTLGEVFDGSPGDLVEVVTSKMMSDTTDYHEKVYQYRYYSANNDGGMDYDGLGVVDLQGRDHQLLAAIYPEQMEFYADYLIQEAENQNGQSGTLLGDDTTGLYSTYYSAGFGAVSDAASLLRWVRFDNSTVGHSHPNADAFLLANSRWQSLYDIAGKILSYYPDGSMGNTDGRVKTQIVSSGDGSDSCGCGSATSGMNLGKRFDYLYRRYTLPAVIADPPTGSTESNGYSCQVVESYLSFDSGLEYLPYRVECHDYFWPSTLAEGMIASSNGIARRGAGLTKIAKATVPADIDWNFVPDDYNSNPVFATTGNRWATGFEYDLDTNPNTGDYNSYRKLLRKLSPAAIGNTYVPAGSTSITSAPDWDHDPTSGLIHVYNYDSGNGWLDWYGVSDGVNGTPVKLAEYARDSTTRPDLANEVVRRPGTGPAGDIPVERTTITRGYYGGIGGNPLGGDEADAVVAWERQKQDAETPTQNGPAGTVDYSSWRIWDEQGQLRWQRDASGTLTCYAEYDAKTGVATHVIFDADPSNTSYVTSDITLSDSNFPGLTAGNGWSVPSRSSYEELEEISEVDLLGRVVMHENAAGVRSYMQYETRIVQTVADSGAVVDRGVPYYSSLHFPHGFSGSSGTEFDGPVRIVAQNAAGKTVLSESYIAQDASGSYDPLAGNYSLGNKVEKSEAELLLSGVIKKSRVWHDVDAAAADGSYFTSYEHDSLGRLSKVIDPEGGISAYTEYDLLDRATVNEVGTRDLSTGSDTTAVVSKVYYDSDQTLTQGVGNGNVTVQEEFPGDGTTRTTTIWYDFRDRMIAQENPQAPHSVYAYDDLNRVVESARITTSAMPAPPPVPSSSSGRSVYARNHYNNRGMVFKNQTAIDPSQSSPSYLESNRWFDEDGNVIASWSPNSPATKYELDALDRPSVVYQTDRDGDGLPGTGSYAHASSVSNDRVISQTEYRYIGNGVDGAGLVDLVTNRMRHHDTSDTGALSTSISVATYTGYAFDDASRQTHTLSYGTNHSQTSTNGSKDFVSNTVPPSTPYVTDISSNSDALISQIGYDEWGRNDRVFDPEGKETRTIFDDMSRTIATIESRANLYSTPTSNEITWDDQGDSDPDNDNWKVTWPGASANLTDRDRVTTFAYDGNSNVVKRTAHLNDGSSQVTQYVYATSNSAGGGTMDSLLDSANLLSAVHYPNETTGAADTSAAYTVSYAYNRLGELKGTTDQNGTRHKITRDSLGRITSDDAELLGTNIDGSVREITASFDEHGRIDEVQSLDDTSGVVNAVKFNYTPLHQIQRVYQEHDGAVSTSGTVSDSVIYSYADAAPSASGGNYSRLSGIQYPQDVLDLNGDTFNLNYSSGIDNQTSRMTSFYSELWHPITDPQTQDPLIDSVIVSYDYLGLGMDVKVDYPQITTHLTAVQGYDGSSSAGEYPGFDQYGRRVWQAWVRDTFDEGTDVLYPDQPNQTPLMARRYAYDDMSNRILDVDGRPGAVPVDRDWEYEYDELDRLKTAKRGARNSELDPTSVGTIADYSRQWNLDMLGNWDNVITDTNTDGVFDGLIDDLEDRVSNEANEITSRTGAVSGVTFSPEYDNAGNFSSNGSSTASDLVYTHDAWNRLVKIERVPDVGSPVTVLENTFNGLNWRVNRKVDLSKSAYDGLDESRDYFYSAGWQMIEEHVDRDLDGAVDHYTQQVWGARYIDDAVTKRITEISTSASRQYYYLTDAMFSVRALADSTGRVQERIDYSPYGVATHSYAGDVNNDGVINFFDVGIVTTNASSTDPLYPGRTGYDPDVDSDGNGLLNFFDISAFLAQNADFGGSGGINPAGWLTDPTDVDWTDNQIGYDGYHFDYVGATDATASGVYCVRHRVYDPGLGAWLQRDPDGYIDGMNRNGYVGQSPLLYLDTFGKHRQCVSMAAYVWPDHVPPYQRTRSNKTRLADRVDFEVCWTCEDGKLILHTGSINVKDQPEYWDADDVFDGISTVINIFTPFSGSTTDEYKVHVHDQYFEDCPDGAEGRVVVLAIDAWREVTRETSLGIGVGKYGINIDINLPSKTTTEGHSQMQYLRISCCCGGDSGAEDTWPLNPGDDPMDWEFR